MSTDDELERFLQERIREIYERAQQQAEPYLSRLAYLRSLRPPPPVFLDPAQFPQALKDQLTEIAKSLPPLLGTDI